MQIETPSPQIVPSPLSSPETYYPPSPQPVKTPPTPAVPFRTPEENRVIVMENKENAVAFKEEGKKQSLSLERVRVRSNEPNSPLLGLQAPARGEKRASWVEESNKEQLRAGKHLKQSHDFGNRTPIFRKL